MEEGAQRNASTASEELADYYAKWQRRIRIARKNKYWGLMSKTFKFILHFLVVMILLFCSAQVRSLVFAGPTISKRLAYFSTLYKKIQKELRYYVNGTRWESLRV